MSDLLERMRKAVEVVSSDVPEGTLKEQAEGFLGGPVDDDVMEVFKMMSSKVAKSIFMVYLEKGSDPITAIDLSRIATLIAGMAIGKRLGAEEGEEFGRITAHLMKDTHES